MIPSLSRRKRRSAARSWAASSYSSGVGSGTAPILTLSAAFLTRARGNGSPVPRRLLAWGLWWIACWWAFQLLSGDWNHYEWVGGACVATVAATLAELLRVLAGLDLQLRPERFLRVPSALLQVPIDFWRLRRRAPAPHRPGRTSRGSPTRTRIGAEALTVLIAGFSPNAYVVDIDRRRTVLLHDLVAAARLARSPRERLH